MELSGKNLATVENFKNDQQSIQVKKLESSNSL